MMGPLFALALLVPTLLALPVGAWPAVRPVAVRAAPWAALPALALALAASPGDALDVPWVLLGIRLALDETGQVFLLLTALLWALAGWYGATYMAHDRVRHRFWVFFLLAMTGNFGLVLSQDILAFYTFFALMTFASYGLVVHDGLSFSLRAGTVYIILAVIGEFLLLVGFILAARAVGGLDLAAVPAAIAVAPERALIVVLLLGGFGVKAGLVPLHVWLPMAHPAAPTPASAVLSGAMIKAGLLGWLRFLPAGEAALPDFAVLLLVLGIGGAFYGVAVGLTQTNPKATLAYSSVSQMGLIVAALGLGLASREAWPFALTAVLIYALHHGLAKGALFLGVGVAGSHLRRPWQRTLMLALLALPALALAGAPLTSGAVAKMALKEPVALAPFPWPLWLDWLLPFAAVGTTLLMARFLFIAHRMALSGDHAHESAPGLWVPWVLLILAAAFATWAVPFAYMVHTVGEPVLPPGPLWEAGWPVALGGLIALVGWGLHRARGWRLREISPGDLVVPLDAAIRRSVRWGWAASQFVLAGLSARPLRNIATNANIFSQVRLGYGEARLGEWGIAGVVLPAVVVGLVVLLSW